MHTEVLPATSGELLATLTSRGATEFHGWVLAGGTGLGAAARPPDLRRLPIFSYA